MQRLARLSRLRPNPFDTAKHAARLRQGISTGPGPETIRLQRVRFTKPKRSAFRRAFPWACIFFALYTSGFIGVEVVEEDEEEEEEEEEEHGHEDEGEDAGSLWFIPLPFTEELHQLPDYPKNSPVLAFFSLVQHRPDVSKKIRVGISDLVCSQYGMDQMLVGHFGKPTGWDSWINLSYPKRPEPEWTQKGILIGDGVIAYARKGPVDPHVINMLHKVLWPAPAMHALWTHATTLATAYTRQLLNSPAPPAETHSPQDARMGQAPGEQRAQVPLPMKRQMPGGPGATPPSDRPKGGGPLTPPVDSGRYGAQAGGAKPDVPGIGGAQPKPIDDSGASPDVMRDLYPQEWNRLMHSLRTLWRRKPRSPPPGCVHVNGLVNVRTTHCIVHLSVDAFFDPSKMKFDPGSMAVRLKGAAPYSPKKKS